MWTADARNRSAAVGVLESVTPEGATAEERQIFERALGRGRAPWDSSLRDDLSDVVGYVRGLFSSRRRGEDCEAELPVREGRRARASHDDDLFDVAIRSAFAHRATVGPPLEPGSYWDLRSRDELARHLDAPADGGYRGSGRAETMRARYEPSWFEHVCFRFGTRSPYPGVAARGAWLTADELWIDDGEAVWSAALEHLRVVHRGRHTTANGGVEPYDLAYLWLLAGAGPTYRIPRSGELGEALRRRIPGYFT